MRKILFVFSLVVGSLCGMSCSSDDHRVIIDSNESIEPPISQVNRLIGEWQIKTVQFSKFEDRGIPANDGCMIEGIRGFAFKDDHTFTFVIGGGSGFDTSAKKYWEWSGDEKDFEIKQLNPSMPPYNFGFKPSNVELVETAGVLSLSFTAALSNGSIAQFSLVKAPIEDQPSILTLPSGEVFSCDLFNAPKSLQNLLVNNTWILEKGQRVFKANFTDVPTQADRAKSILAFSLLPADQSFIRYTFPMGVASAKADTWVYDEAANAFATTYKSEAFGGNDLRFQVKVSKIDDSKMEFWFTDEQGTSEKRVFVKHSSFLNTEESLSQLDALLNEITAAGTTN